MIFMVISVFSYLLTDGNTFKFLAAHLCALLSDILWIIRIFGPFYTYMLAS